ncbi:hypothetical protein FRC14_001769 [Serendipita sp. 396]|nr:hypothetical protein FRC14_001769 [Serendipita sp. 396]
MAEASSRLDNAAIHIFAITIQQKAHRALRSVSLRINDNRNDIPWEHASQDAFKATFTSPLVISPSDSLNLELHSSFAPIGTPFISGKNRLVCISAQQLLHDHTNGGHQQEWKQTLDKAEVTILLSHQTGATRPGPIAGTSFDRPESVQLTPTTEDILDICPRFRVLLIGKSGVGKSSLINKAFGVDDALVSHSAPGQAEIEKEIVSIVNPRFVLHDSRGFEPGETSNFDAVCNFILSRNLKPDLKDKLHAIWVCMATPASGSRILETGVEELFRRKKDGDFGEVPMISVFTKFDELVDREVMKLEIANSKLSKKLSDREVFESARQNANKAFEGECVVPFQTSSNVRIPYKAVSTQPGYETTLTDLIEITFKNVQQHVSPEAAVSTAIAQKPNSAVKIEGCIAVGKLRYWRSLASSVNFPGKTLKACLDVIHTDIIEVWNLNDPKLNLKSKEFKALMSNLVEESVQGKVPSSPNKGLATSVPILAAIAGIVGALSGPAAPIVIPIVGAFVLAKWAYDVYQASRSNLERLMAYIIDLTLVMQNIFWLADAADGTHPTSRRLIKLAFRAYSESDTNGKVHVLIQEHVKQAKSFIPGGQDATLEAIEDIIRQCTFTPDEMIKWRQELPPFGPGKKDEPWNLQ